MVVAAIVAAVVVVIVVSTAVAVGVVIVTGTAGPAPGAEPDRVSSWHRLIVVMGVFDIFKENGGLRWL